MSNEKKQIAAVEGLFSWPSDDPRLIASRCRSCGSVRFPARSTCHNPYCNKDDVEEILLNKRGKLYSYTIHHYCPPPPFHPPDPFVPYGIGLVELPEGIRIMGMLTQCDLELKINMDVELVAEKLYDDDKGNEIMGWKWRPLEA